MGPVGKEEEALARAAQLVEGLSELGAAVDIARKSENKKNDKLLLNDKTNQQMSLEYVSRFSSVAFFKAPEWMLPATLRISFHSRW